MVLVQSVGPRGAFAKSHLSILHKIRSILIIFAAGGGWLIDEIERGLKQPARFFCFFFNKNLIIIICLLQIKEWLSITPHDFVFSSLLDFTYVGRIRPLFYIITDNVMAMQGLAMPQNLRNYFRSLVLMPVVDLRIVIYPPAIYFRVCWRWNVSLLLWTVSLCQALTQA